MPCSITLAAASTIAVPLDMIDLEPPVPPPATRRSLSPCTRRMLLERNAELLAQHLRERRSVALPKSSVPVSNVTRAVGLEDDAAHLLGGRGGDLEEIADTEPAQLAALAALAPPARKALDVGGLDRLPQHGGKVAAVVGHAGGGLVGDVAALDLVAPAQLQAVDLAARPAAASINRSM